MSATIIVKTVVITTLILIVASLGSALFSLIRDKSQSERTVKALTVRIALSIALLAFVMISGKLGYLTPSGMP
ncbi:MAG: twin transmembrane helix small protein [Gammaproteobacteria bacterium]